MTNPARKKPGAYMGIPQYAGGIAGGAGPMQGRSPSPTFIQSTGPDIAGTITIPANAVVGDYIVLMHFWASNTTPTTPASPGTWTQLATAGFTGVGRITAYGHFIAEGEPGTAVTVSTGSSAIYCMNIYRGVNTGTPMDNTVVAGQTAAASTTKTVPGITTLTNFATVLAMMGQTTSTITNITPGTNRLNSNGGGTTLIAAQELGVATAGASGDFTVTQGTQQRLFYITIAMRPA